MQSLKFYTFDVKPIVTKKFACNFLWKESEEKKYDNKILSCDFDESESWIFQNRSMLSQDFTSNIFELHEPKTGGKGKLWYNFPDLTRLKHAKFSWT